MLVKYPLMGPTNIGLSVCRLSRMYISLVNDLSSSNSGRCVSNLPLNLFVCQLVIWRVLMLGPYLCPFDLRC